MLLSGMNPANLASPSILEEVDLARHAVGSRPLSFPRLASTAADLDIRRALLPRFPYALLFLQLETEIRVLAVAHPKRHPDYWLNRLHAP